jgi:hypothetical protein
LIGSAVYLYIKWRQSNELEAVGHLVALEGK